MGSSTITPALVKELREKTGVGMAKCKDALDQAGGDMEEAIAILRKAGMMSAAKKEGRSTKEGAVMAFQTHDVVAVVEVNAETDFVVKNERFQEFCNNIVQEVALKSPASLEEFLQQSYSKDPHITIDQYRSLLIQTIGENIQIRRLEVFPKKNGQSIGVYSHLGGKILTVVVLEGSGEEPLAKEVAMHVAAAFPQYLSPEEIPKEVLQMEKDIAEEQVKGKPANIVDKILQGKLNAFYDQCCLTRQKYIRDDSVSVGEYVKKQGSAHGKEVRILGFLRWMAGKE
jgi:elongation factor Ts